MKNYQKKVIESHQYHKGKDTELGGDFSLFD